MTSTLNRRQASANARKKIQVIHTYISANMVGQRRIMTVTHLNRMYLLKLLSVSRLTAVTVTATQADTQSQSVTVTHCQSLQCLQCHLAAACLVIRLLGSITNGWASVNQEAVSMMIDRHNGLRIRTLPQLFRFS